MAAKPKITDALKAGDPARDQARLYGRRRGHKLKPQQKKLMAEMLPQLEVPLVEPQSLDPANYFDAPQCQEIWLEIGFGGGEHLAARAKQSPDVGFIGAEFFVNGVASMLTHIEQQGLSNVRLHTVDGRRFLESLKSASISRAFLLYPDPWPKSRHHKRRFISDWSLDQLARVLKPGAPFLVATDIEDYCRWTLSHIRRHPDFSWQAECSADWRVPPGGWPGTRYEAKAIREGRTPTYLSFIRNP